ncbi:hypothetical protein HGRIS_000972 [Hohenbuehelia grisea]|uniref:Cytochrome P450 n=1 Tax=Hohenbuehelia grisea TaxID=104357 RepID=A0ABR3IQ98_9AGAR
MSLSPGLVAAGLACGIFILYHTQKARSNPPLPPGPPADPIIGHLRILPEANQHLVFHEWCKRYGNIIYLHCLGRSIIVLNDLESAVELLEKRSNNYSDRPKFRYFELLGWKASVTFMQYGRRFRKHRRLLNEAFNSDICETYRPMQRDLAHGLAQRLMERPEEFDSILNWYSVAIVMRITYGRHVASNDDMYVEMARDASALFANAGPPGGNPIDLFPFLQHLPSWFPGTYYANFARKWSHIVHKLHDYPYDAVKRQVADGTAESSYISTNLERGMERDLSDEEAEDIKATAASIYAAGHETTWATALWFVLAMVLYPECQRKAQAEIDAVVGDRMPDYADRPALPYVECLIQEVFRWQPVVPLGIPHRAMKDDVYNGMFIPEGSIVLANATGMSRDENIYKDPDRFIPLRFRPQPEGNSEPHPEATFGFGRRICPGRHLAVGSVYMAVVTILATLDISRKLDDNGKEIIPVVECQTGLGSHPKPFDCVISTRLIGKQRLAGQTA